MRSRPTIALLVATALLPAALAAQDAGTVEGRVRDEAGAAVFAADVTLLDGARAVAGGATDRLGWYRLAPVPPGTYTVRVTRIGHADAVREGVAVAPGEATTVEVVLPRAAVAVEGVRVEAARGRDRERFEELAGVTVREMSLEELKQVPGVAEADPLRAVEVLPGVVSTSDFSAAFHVRGGSADQNLILLDGAPVFSPFHLGGFFSVFNADMVERAELRSGGFPADHGGRVSSILLVESDAGDGRTAVDGGVSVLAARAALGGGVDDVPALGLRTVRARVSARRSYFDALLKPVFDFPYHLTDVQGVVEAWTGAGDRIRVTGYTGDDVLDLRALEDQDFPLRIDWTWGNDVLGLRWTRPRPGGGALDVSAGATRYGTRLRFPDFQDTDFRSRIRQEYLHAQMSGHGAGAWGARGGVALERFRYGNRAVSGGTEFGRGEGSGWLTGGWAQAEWRPRRWRVEVGARLDGWHASPGETVWEPSPRVAVKRFLGSGDLAE
ncbi:MAG: TonB-dependent receptor, partial [Rhodothermales bacterium]|nr:TonB-dependent receptor [Rhodothermales bacterium]